MSRIQSVLCCFALGLLASASSFASSVVKIRVDDTIQPISAEYVERAVEHARQTNADAVLIELRTPAAWSTPPARSSRKFSPRPCR